MLGRRPDARDIFYGEDEHAEPVEQLQTGAVPRGDIGHGVGDGRGDVADNEPDQHPVDDARGRLPPPAMLQNLEGALAQYVPGLWLGVHLSFRPRGCTRSPLSIPYARSKPNSTHPACEGLTLAPDRARVADNLETGSSPMRAILAYLTTKPGKEAQFQELMTAQAKRCLANEPGCLQFDVVQDPKSPTRFVMLEVYKDDAAIKAHQDSQHFKDFRPVVGDLVADRKVEIFNMVSDGKAKR
jgi:autoinducer 2-degrading protein